MYLLNQPQYLTKKAYPISDIGQALYLRLLLIVLYVYDTKDHFKYRKTLYLS